MRLTTLALVGPTASGKSSIAVEVARHLGGEVISTDSMQAYRGMRIGTAVPSHAEQDGVPHRMFEEWPLTHALTVVEYRDRAREYIRAALAASRVPIVVGGSGLYVAAVLDELDFPGTDPRVRYRWQALLDEKGVDWLYQQLELRDPVAARDINPRNGRRIVRALEVIEMTGEPFVARLPKPTDVFTTRRFGLRIDRAVLDERITERVHRMWAEGFVAEVESLADDLASAPTARMALGYLPILDFLQGRCSEDEARQRTIDDTKKFARRQQRWFAKDERVEWWDYSDPGLVEAMVSAGTRT